MLQHSMDLLALNQLVNSEERGLAYYEKLARRGSTALRGGLALRPLVLGRRNEALDRALADAERTGRSVHVIAGADHLVEHPALVDVPLVGGERLRSGLRRTIADRVWWAAKPADSR